MLGTGSSFLHYIQLTYFFVRYCSDYTRFQTLRKMVNRLLYLSNRPNPYMYVGGIEVIQFWFKICLGIQDALKDLLVDCNRLTELGGSSALSSAVVESITQCVETLKKDKEELHHLGQMMGCLHPSFMNSGRRFTCYEKVVQF